MKRGLRMIGINVKKRNNRFYDRDFMIIKNKIKTMKIYIESENKIQFY
jgi:hypothetical protein